MTTPFTATTETMQTMQTMQTMHSTQATATSSLVGVWGVAGFGILSRPGAEAADAKTVKPDTVWSGMHTQSRPNSCFGTWLKEEGDSGIEGHRPYASFD